MINFDIVIAVLGAVYILLSSPRRRGSIAPQERVSELSVAKDLLLSLNRYLALLKDNKVSGHAVDPRLRGDDSYTLRKKHAGKT